MIIKFTHIFKEPKKSRDFSNYYSINKEKHNEVESKVYVIFQGKW